MAKLFHPDKNSDPNAVDKFRRINNAYVAISEELQKNQTGDNIGSRHTRRTGNKRGTDSTIKSEGLTGNHAPTIREKTQSVVVILNDSDVKYWIKICSRMYGQPKDQGLNGLKFTSFFELSDSEQYGSIHVTIYKTTHKVLVQGNSYLLWLDDHFPEIKSQIKSEQAQLKLKSSHDSEAVNIPQTPL